MFNIEISLLILVSN